MEKLKFYLFLNAIFSHVCGMCALVWDTNLNNFFNISNEYIIPFIGFNLLVFSVFVWFVLKSYRDNKAVVNLISFLDILWVIGSVIIVAFSLFDLSKRGYVLITLIAIWIGFLAIKQIKHNKGIEESEKLVA